MVNNLKIPVGTSNLRLARITKDTKETLTIEKVDKVAEDYLQKINAQPESSSEPVYGSNKKLATINSKSAGKGTIELAALPPSLEMAIQGATKDEHGIIKFTSNDVSHEWALSFQIDYQDGTYALVGLGKVVFQLIDESSETKEDKAKAQPIKLEFESMDRINDDFYKLKVYSDDESFKEAEFYKQLFKEEASLSL